MRVAQLCEVLTFVESLMITMLQRDFSGSNLQIFPHTIIAYKRD
jgi:hypothetical protein